MPLQATSGAASYDAFGGGVPVVPAYIEEVFSTFLYTGNGSTQTITNSIDLSTKGGLVWIKGRGQLSGGIDVDNVLFDTARGASKILYSNLTDAQSTTSWSTAFNNNGFSFNTASGYVNGSNVTVGYASWTFAKAPKFFDVVTYTGNGTAGRTIAHSLGSVPGCIFVKQTNVSGENWDVYHRSLANNKQLYLNTTDAQLTTSSWNSTTPTSTVFTVGDGSSINANGSTYVAYLFAHNAGGFGLTGTDNVISCGSYVRSNGKVTLGYEPQWIMIKSATGVSSWRMVDNMRGLTASGTDAYMFANLTNAEATGSDILSIDSTGFTDLSSASSETIIYIAIRRGPMKVPTSGTSVFAPIARTGTGSATTISGIGFAPDLLWDGIRNTAGYGNFLMDKLRGGSQRLGGASTAAEATESPAVVTQFGNTSVAISASGTVNDSGVTYVNWFMQRAPSFFDEVCYSGNSTAGRTLTHNLGVVPQLIIVKARTIDVGWAVYAESAGNTKYSELNDVTRFTTGINCWNDTSPTASVFSLSSNARVNRTGDTYVAYLFATCAGVSKVGSYTGTGSLQTINCGFTSGARFVLIKNQNVNGDWYVWDSARGISSSNDPYLLLNSTAAEVTNTNYVDTDSTGFKVTGNTAVNTSGDTYIFLAIA